MGGRVGLFSLISQGQEKWLAKVDRELWALYQARNALNFCEDLLWVELFGKHLFFCGEIPFHNKPDKWSQFLLSFDTIWCLSFLISGPSKGRFVRVYTRGFQRTVL